ncbi:DUF6161 domain-containing protein [Sulfitobacter delicatus]|uniref:DUF6161 domain-containing protein n=1 Tax=Sulfitobacter delicatus TaxID=218672 RepID=UPI0011136DA7|nr:DUF6161 domain-containing protein [Sulfitobacter delicatus]
MKFIIELSGGQLKADTFSELRQLVSSEHEFWSSFDFSLLENATTLNLWRQKLASCRSHIIGLLQFWESRLSFLDEQDGRAVNEFFPRFKSDIESSTVRPPHSSSPTALAFAQNYREANYQDAGALVLGLAYSQDPKLYNNINNTSLEGAILGFSRGYYLAISSVAAVGSGERSSADIDLKLQAADNLLRKSAENMEVISHRRAELLEELERSKEDTAVRWKRLHGRIVDSARNQNKEAKVEEDRRSERFEELLQAFNAHMRLSRPVDLWNDLQKEHRDNAAKAWSLFLGGSILFAVAAVSSVIFLGDAIADAFVPSSCQIGFEKSCDSISPKGPLVVSAIFLVSTVWLWFLRLQMKVHLSERHLFLDARERKAFAETYLSLLKGGEVTGEHEAVVLQSLFRPTQDGIINDDGAMDIGLSGMISKALSK